MLLDVSPAISAVAALYFLGTFSVRFLSLGVLVHAALVLHRGLSIGRLPIVGTHDTLVFFSLSIALFTIAFGPYLKRKTAFLRVASGAALAFLIPCFFAPAHSGPLPPVLQTFWFEIHVVLSFFSYALFVSGAICGIFYLYYRDVEIERVQYRALLTGYTFFSVSMIAGGIWAFYAWGTYWLWTPKELWTSVLWLYYSLYLHLRYHRRFAGIPAGAVGVAGVFVMLFTYLGVGLLMKSSHSF